MPTMPIYQSCVGSYFLLVPFNFFSFIYFILVAAQVETYLCTLAKGQRAVSSIFFHTSLRARCPQYVHTCEYIIFMHVLFAARSQTYGKIYSTDTRQLLVACSLGQCINITSRNKRNIFSLKNKQKNNLINIFKYDEHKSEVRIGCKRGQNSLRIMYNQMASQSKSSELIQPKMKSYLLPKDRTA